MPLFRLQRTEQLPIEVAVRWWSRLTVLLAFEIRILFHAPSTVIWAFPGCWERGWLEKGVNNI